DDPRLPAPNAGASGPSWADLENGLRGEALAQHGDVREPLLEVAVGEEAVPVIVDLVAEENRLAVVEEPWTVVRRFARAEVDDGECDVVERDALTVSDRRVGEDSVRGPLLAEDGSDNCVLACVVADNRVDHALRR